MKLENGADAESWKLESSRLSVSCNFCPCVASSIKDTTHVRDTCIERAWRSSHFRRIQVVEVDDRVGGRATIAQ